MNLHTHKTLLGFLAAAVALFFTGCVTVKQATVTDSTFNTAGWKSQAGSGEQNEQAIEATNDVAPNTDTGAL